MPYKDPEVRKQRHTAYMKIYLQDPENYKAHRARVKRNKLLRVEQIREVIAAAKQGKRCRLCPEDAPCCLSFHHPDPENKEFSISQARTLWPSWEQLEAEIAKCVLICENCHRKIHAGILALPEVGSGGPS